MPVIKLLHTYGNETEAAMQEVVMAKLGDEKVKVEKAMKKKDHPHYGRVADFAVTPSWTTTPEGVLVELSYKLR